MRASRVRRLALGLSRLERLTSKSEEAYSSRLYSQRELEMVYEGAFIGDVVDFEIFIAGLFGDILLGKTSYNRRRVVSKARVRSVPAAESVIRVGRPFVDWLPYRHTEERAKALLRGGSPFTELSQAQRSNIGRWMVIRNAIAHASNHSTARFKQSVANGRHLSPSERQPGFFLRSEVRRGVSQFRHIIEQINTIAKVLAGPISSAKQSR